MNDLLEAAKKPMIFALAAGIGCLTAALLAEIFLWASSKGRPVQTICLTIDVSGSMAGNKLDEVKDAAKKFIEKRNLSKDYVALAIFSSVGKEAVPLTHNKKELFDSIDKLLAYGGTNFEDAISVSQKIISKSGGKKKAILIFTDGASSQGDPQKAVETSDKLRKDGVRIFAVSTQDGDMPYLAGLTGTIDRVIGTQDGRFEEAFAKAEEMISESLMGAGGDFTTAELFIRTDGWTIFLALGIALTLVAVQNYFLKKTLLPTQQFILVAIGSIAAGMIAGTLGEISHQVFGVVKLGPLGQVIGWTTLGAGLAYGMIYFIPNLNRVKALSFGAAGGFSGSLAFLVISMSTETGGRLLGAFLLGFCIGLLIALVETIYRNVWLMAMYDPRNFAQVNLGQQPVTVGSGKSDTVFIAGVVAKAGTFQTSEGQIRYTDKNGTQTLQPGSRVRIGKVELVVCSKDVPFSPSKFYPMKMSKAKEQQRNQRKE
ncbi:MAG: VWA domain-containing protein [Planctomycetaceae bacterium]|jgi:Ca-activated chloride channel family protein|nr:VWA domain-containing protein [Planctomycetaceae bacterium]